MATRITQAGAEAGVAGGSAARLTQSGAEVGVAGGAVARITQAGAEVLTPNPQTAGSGVCQVTSGTVAYRLRIRTAADDGDELLVSTIVGTNPYILEAPSGDGQTIDPLTSHSDVGAFTCRVIDALTTGTDRVVTEVLADANDRWQLLSRRAYIEESDDGGTSWSVLVAGYVNSISMPDALTFDFTVGESRRAVGRRKLFLEAEGDFDRLSNIVGTPVRGGFGPLTDYGGWRFSVTDVGLTYVTLTFVEGMVYTGRLGALTFTQPEFVLVRTLTSDVRDSINGTAEPYGIIDDPIPANDLAGLFGGLVARVEDASGNLLGSFTPFIRTDNTFSGLFKYWLIDPSEQLSLDWTASQPTAGDQVIIWISPKAIDERNPVHITGHPVDLAAEALELAGETIDAGAKAATKSAIGDDAFVSLRITRAQSVAEFVETLGALYGFTTRAGTDGETEFMPTRTMSAVPTQAITKSCLRGEGDPFSLDEQSIVNRVTVRHLRYDNWIPTDQGERPFDLIKAIPEAVTYDYGETAQYGDHPLELEIPGRIETRRQSQLDTQSGNEVDLDAYVTALGDALFLRHGRGADVAMLPLLRGESAQVGDLLLLDIDYLPNGAVRGGQKVVQVIQATPTPEGIDARVMVMTQVTTQPTTDPTFTIVANTADPRHVADIAVTNAGSLPAGAQVRVEWAIGTSITSGTLLAVLDIGAGHTTISTPGVDAGTTVSVRMRTELQGQVPGAWTGWQSVALTALSPPTGLSAVAVDAQSYDLTWTNAETDVPVEILLKLASDPAFTIIPRFPFQLLPPGSDRFRITGLTSGVAYTAGVRYRETPPYAGTSTIATAALNPSGTAPTLNPPTAPVAWAGRLDTNGVRHIDGTFGMDVLASELPSFVEFDVAVETAVGSGTAGTFQLAATLDSVQGGVTRFTSTAPNDGKLRYMHARHVRSGSTASTYTSTVSVNPWSTSAPGAPSDAEVVMRATSSAFPSGRVVVDDDIVADFSVANQVTFSVGADGRTVIVMAQFGDGQAAPNLNARCGIRLPFNLDVLDWMIWADASGSAVVDVRRTTYTAFSFASIAASAKPSLSTASKNQDTTLTGWTTALDADDLLDFLLESLTTCKLVMVALKCRRRLT